MVKRLLFISLSCMLILSLFFCVMTFAEEDTTNPDDVKQQYQDVKAEIDRLQKQLMSLQGQERTLTNQINQFNSQIQVTQLQIIETRQQINQLNADITILQSQIDGLEITLEKISIQLADRVLQTYQRGEITPLQLLIASDGFDKFLTRYAYIQYMQDYDKKILLQLQNNQNTISDKKKELEIKQKEVEKKKKQLETLKNTLDSQKQAKETLLSTTKNDETRYQKLLEAAKSKEQALSKLVFAGGKVGYTMELYGLSKQGSVSKGSRIGTMGNSGYPRCTNAAHLHMEVIESGVIGSTELGGNLVSPYSYLSSRSLSVFQDDNSIGVSSFGAGSWDWPLSNPVITQQFGKTPWSSRYLGGYHTGVDMVDYNDRTVRAPASGTLYYAKLACGSVINIAIIDHGNGVLSDYLHLE
jgi:peptidoglycan hydrolase CwlO-like protein